MYQIRLETSCHRPERIATCAEAPHRSCGRYASLSSGQEALGPPVLALCHFRQLFEFAVTENAKMNEITPRQNNPLKQAQAKQNMGVSKVLQNQCSVNRHSRNSIVISSSNAAHPPLWWVGSIVIAGFDYFFRNSLSSSVAMAAIALHSS